MVEAFPLEELKLKTFFFVTLTFLNSMYQQGFFCEEARIEQDTTLKEEIYETGEKVM